MLTVIDLQGNHYTAISNIPRVQRVNGEREITLSFLHGEINDAFLSEIETGWKANFKGDIYHLFNEKEDKHGNKEFDAVLDFFHHFNGRWHVDEEENKSMTINDSIRPLFDNSDYVLSIIDNFYANTMSFSKQQNSTERFLYFIGRHKAEFNIPIGTKTVQVRNKIGVQRNDLLIHEDDNLIDFNINTDTGSFCTAIRYYYDFKATGDSEESTEKEPTKNDVYVSPMASKYGVHYGEPIYDERFSVKANAEQAAKEKQESTWQSSFEIGAELFETPLNIGDEVPFVVPSKGINGYIRVVEINETFDEDGDLIEATYTFGNENIANQYRKMQYDAIQDVQDMLNGKKPIPYSVLPKAIREATNIINAGDTTQFYYRADGIYGYNTENKNWVVRMNANGLGYSTDGGQTYSNAITHLGVVTEALTAGTIDANRITIFGDKGTNRIEIDGDKIKVWDSTNPNVYTEISKGRLHANRGALSVTGKDGRELIIDGYMKGQPVANLNIWNSHAVEMEGNRDLIITKDTFERVYTIYDQWRSNRLDLLMNYSLKESSPNTFRNLDVRVVDMYGGNVVYTERMNVYKNTTEGQDFKRLSIDLKNYFNTVVDYRNLHLYVEVRMINVYTNIALFRVNKGEVYD